MREASEKNPEQIFELAMSDCVASTRTKIIHILHDFTNKILIDTALKSYMLISTSCDTIFGVV